MEEPENKELVRLLRERIRARGRVTFAEFMELVLYHPVAGYYNSFREKTVPGGDYYTSPHVHPIFGQLIARQVHQMWEILGHPAPFTLVEMGGGRGFLCSDILNYCRSQFAEFYRCLGYVLAEVSGPSIEKQRSLLSPFLHERKVEGKANYGGRMPPEWLADLAPLGTDWSKPFLTTCPWLIAVFAEPFASSPTGLSKHYYVTESVGIAVGFLLAALHHSGLATLTHTPSPMGFLRDVLGRPPHERPFVLVAVGHPADGCEVPDLESKPLESIRTVL